MSDRRREYTYWALMVAAAIILAFPLGLQMTFWQGVTLGFCVTMGRAAARINERRKIQVPGGTP